MCRGINHLTFYLTFFSAHFHYYFYILLKTICICCTATFSSYIRNKKLKKYKKNEERNPGINEKRWRPLKRFNNSKQKNYYYYYCCSVSFLLFCGKTYEHFRIRVRKCTQLQFKCAFATAVNLTHSNAFALKLYHICRWVCICASVLPQSLLTIIKCVAEWLTGWLDDWLTDWLHVMDEWHRTVRV